MIKLIIGLGNPGKQYDNTRHNAGAWFAQQVAIRFQSKFKVESKFHAQITQINTGEHSCFIAIPSTYMNESGRCIQALMRFYKLNPEELLIAHDELDLDPGIARLKLSGGHGGHNGLRSIIQNIGREFWRLRIGIGHPGHKDQVSGFVLSKASLSDQQQIRQAINESSYCLDDLLSANFDRAMRTLHTTK